MNVADSGKRKYNIFRVELLGLRYRRTPYVLFHDIFDVLLCQGILLNILYILGNTLDNGVNLRKRRVAFQSIVYRLPDCTRRQRIFNGTLDYSLNLRGCQVVAGIFSYNAFHLCLGQGTGKRSGNNFLKLLLRQSIASAFCRSVLLKSSRYCGSNRLLAFRIGKADIHLGKLFGQHIFKFCLPVAIQACHQLFQL